MKTLTRFASALCVMSAVQAVYADDSVTIPLNDNKDTTFSISLTSHVGNQWTYQVNKVKGRDLSHWDLLVPSCIGHFSNYTSGAEIGKDGSIKDFDATGIKWNTTGGTFSFTLDANYPSAQVDVLAKSGTQHAVKTITGPNCTSVPTPPVVEEPIPPVVEEPIPPVAEEPVVAEQCGVDWHYTLDSTNDSSGDSPESSTNSVGNTYFEVYGSAIKLDDETVTVAINARLPLGGGVGNSRKIAWSDFFIDFNGKLYGVRFDNKNDTTYPVGLYEVSQATSLTKSNSGHSTFSDYSAYIKNRGGLPTLGDLSILDNGYFRNADKMPTVIKTGVKVADIQILDNATLTAQGLDFATNLGLAPSRYTPTTPYSSTNKKPANELGEYTFGFSFPRQANMTDAFIAYVFTECGNDGIAMVSSLPSCEVIPPVVEEPVPPIEEPTPPVVEEPVPPVEEPTPPVVEEPVPPVEEPTPPVVEEPVPPVEEPVPPVDEPTPPVEDTPDDSTIGDTADENATTEPQWATTWDGSFYGGDEIVCSLDTNYSVAEKDWWEPQWITVSGWLQLHREGYTGALKAKIITTGHVVNPQSSVIRALTNEGVSCPSELPDCVGEAGKQYIVYQDGSYDSATGTVTSDDNGRVEFTAKAWWPGITQGYLTAMDDIDPNDWDSVKDYVIENHYGVYLRGEGASLLTQVSDTDNNSGKDIYWYPDDRCPKPAVDRYGELAVLANFDAYQMANGNVCLKWTTSMELDNAGFNILRAEHDANLIDNDGYFNIIQVNNRLISSKSSTSLSSESYAYIDKTSEAGVVNYYGIEDVDFEQVRTIHKEFITTPKPCQGETCSSCKAN